MKKDEQLTKRIFSAVLSIILILIILTLIISYFLHPQIEYIRFDSYQIFAIPQNPEGIAADNAGNVYVIDAGCNIVQKFTTDGSFVKEWNINYLEYLFSYECLL
ncbi:MAG: hypothetical protein ACRD6U_07245 [Nitrososphaeraceae archaeon]